MNSDDIFTKGNAWYSVFCSILLALDKDQKEDISKRFEKMIETTIPNNQFTPEKKEKLLSAYKEAYYKFTNRTYSPPETK